MSPVIQGMPVPEDPVIHVSSLIGVQAVLEATRARYLMTLLHEPALMPTPEWILPDNHLRLTCHDIYDEEPGFVAPDATHMREVLAFAERWAGQGPLVIHCMAGISRSTAAAYAVLCAINPKAPEADLARQLRAASPLAMPNSRLVELADTALARDGRMIAAIAALGSGEAISAQPRSFQLRSRF